MNSTLSHKRAWKKGSTPENGLLTGQVVLATGLGFPEILEAKEEE